MTTTTEKKPDAKPDRKPTKVTEFLRYNFSEDELRQKSKDLALSVTRQARTQEEQKAAQAQFKQRIETEQAEIGRLSNNINMGWEMRNIDCIVEYHKPAQGTKRIVRLDTGEVVRESAMSAHELQEELFTEG